MFWRLLNHALLDTILLTNPRETRILHMFRDLFLAPAGLDLQIMAYACNRSNLWFFSSGFSHAWYFGVFFTWSYVFVWHFTSNLKFFFLPIAYSPIFLFTHAHIRSYGNGSGTYIGIRFVFFFYACLSTYFITTVVVISGMGLFMISGGFEGNGVSFFFFLLFGFCTLVLLALVTIDCICNLVYT
jgi:hypothetical protein